MAIEDILKANKDLKPWRPSTEIERDRFYRSKFEKLFYSHASSCITDICNVSEWACVDQKGSFVRGTIGNEIRFETFDELQDFLIEHNAISAYYGTGNLFTVDIDSKDVARYGNCDRHAMFGLDSEKLDKEETEKRENYIRNIAPRGYPYCFDCVAIAVKNIFQVRDVLIKVGVDEESISTYFSGQGAHLECTDPKMCSLGVHSRMFLAKYLDFLGIPIDKIVTYGENRVFRIPGSLHGKVNRAKVKIIPGDDFDINLTGVV